MALSFFVKPSWKKKSFWFTNLGSFFEDLEFEKDLNNWIYKHGMHLNGFNNFMGNCKLPSY